MNGRLTSWAAAAFLVATFTVSASKAERDCFETPNSGPNLGVWRITHNPVIQDHANYHNTQCWSPDGRYLCYTHWGGETTTGGKSSAQVHLVDLHEGRDTRVDQGINPRWGKRQNRLFYVRFDSQKGPSWEKGTELMCCDADSHGIEHVAYGVEAIGQTDFQDRRLVDNREPSPEQAVAADDAVCEVVHR